MAAQDGSASRGGPPRKRSQATPARGSGGKGGKPGGAAGRKPGSGAKPGGARSGKPGGANGGKSRAAETGNPGAGTPRSGTAPTRLPQGTFRLGAVPGATPGKWIDTWKQRMPRVDLLLVPLDAVDQRAALASGTVDAAIVRLPLDPDGLHSIPLYEEVTVVVCAADSHLTAADELRSDDLAGEVLIVPADDVLGIRIGGTEPPRFDPPETTADAIATVAAGVGVVVVPMSLARLHHRKDVEFRPLVDAPTSAIALAWPVEATTDLVEAFVGIVRGRTANSSR